MAVVDPDGGTKDDFNPEVKVHMDMEVCSCTVE